MVLELKLDLSDSLAQEAKSQGLLEPLPLSARCAPN
jgi:hypothetical protein